MTPYAAYIPAERLHVSGILATVACGLYLGWRSEGIFRPAVRIQSVAFWDTFSFILSSILFVLLGAQLRPVLDQLGSYSGWTLARDAVLVFAVVVVDPHRVDVHRPASRGRRQPRPRLARRSTRGRIVSCSAGPACAARSRSRRPSRSPPRSSTATRSSSSPSRRSSPRSSCSASRCRGSSPRSASVPQKVTPEELETRQALVESALRRLDQLETAGAAGDASFRAVRQLYERRWEQLSDGHGGGHVALGEYLDVRRELLDVERSELRRREREGLIDFTTARKIERQLDHEESGLRTAG